MIHFPEEFTEDKEITADVAIIGAGPGGAAAAFKLSKSGKKVVVLEMGAYFNPSQFSRDSTKSLKNLYQDAGQRIAAGNGFFPVMFGKGVGGGTLVNSGISFKPPQKIIDLWSAEYKLKDFSMSSLSKYVSEVEKNVNIEILELGKLGRNNTIFKEGLEKLGYKGGTIPRNTKNCTACAQCFFGCPSGAKQSVDKNFISSAVENGAEVYTFARTSRLEFDPSTKKILSVVANIISPEDGKAKYKLKVTAKHFMLAAGAIGSPWILQKDGLANSSEQVGKNFHCHPSTGLVGVFPEEINGFRSVVQGYYSDQFIDKDILLETVWAPPSVFAAFSPGFGNSVIKSFTEIKHFASAGAMIRDESSGTVSFDGPEVKIEYNLTERDQKLLTEGLYRTSEVMLAAGAHTVYADNPIKPVFKSMTELHDFFRMNDNLGPDIVREGNHGMGTCRMGEDPKNSVVNSFGQSHDISNLWITDVSTFPTALGVNPQITIMALALRNAEYLNGNF